MSGLLDGLPSVASNVAASAVLVAGTAIAHRATRMWRTRAERAVWRPVLRSGHSLGLILTCRPGPFPRSTHRTSINEVRVLLSLTPTFEKIGIDYRVIDSLEASASDLSAMNLLILGGPAVNDVSRRAFEVVQHTLPVGINLQEIAITVGNRRYAPEYSPDTQRVVKDYGLVVRCRNPFDLSHGTYAFLVMGCHGFGTAGTAQLLRDPGLAGQLAAEVDRRDFVAITEVQVQGAEYGTRIVESFFLYRN
jgi:hypothetical protein